MQQKVKMNMNKYGLIDLNWTTYTLLDKYLWSKTRLLSWFSKSSPDLEIARFVKFHDFSKFSMTVSTCHWSPQLSDVSPDNNPPTDRESNPGKHTARLKPSGRGETVSYLAPDLSWGGHFPDEFLGAFLLCLAVRGLVCSAGIGDSSHHMRMDPRRGHRSFLRLLSGGGIKAVGVSLRPVCRSLPLLEARAALRTVSPRCHVS